MLYSAVQELQYIRFPEASLLCGNAIERTCARTAWAAAAILRSIGNNDEPKKRRGKCCDRSGATGDLRSFGPLLSDYPIA